ncbi:hypothetical protein EDC90_103513 [Martelella mediterranea]|uniref:Uncharacterized protein n=1 Tax=Martelella mediterranea TaxID=293089 RepID=A0A4R3NNH7_9HYPH|nr:hypothetical protein EDC90_103513 [Martelella mediterranea]
MSRKSGCLGQQVIGHPVSRVPCQDCPDGLCRQEMISSIANTGSARWRPSPSLIRDPNSQAEGPNIIYEVRCLPPRLVSERGPSAWAHPLEEGAIGFAVFNYGVYGARHLCRDRGVGLATQMSVVSVFRDVAFELVTKAVGSLENGSLAGHPERTTQAGSAASCRQRPWTEACARLSDLEKKTAERAEPKPADVWLARGRATETVYFRSATDPRSMTRQARTCISASS